MIAAVYIGNRNSAVVYMSFTEDRKKESCHLHGAWVQKGGASLPSELVRRYPELDILLINGDYRDELGEPETSMREALRQCGIYGITACNIPKPQHGITAIRCYQEVGRFDTANFPLWPKLEAEINAMPDSFSAVAMALFMGMTVWGDPKVYVTRVIHSQPEVTGRALLDELMS